MKKLLPPETYMERITPFNSLIYISEFQGLQARLRTTDLCIDFAQHVHQNFKSQFESQCCMKCNFPPAMLPQKQDSQLSPNNLIIVPFQLF